MFSAKRAHHQLIKPQNFMRLREQQHNQFMRQQPMMPAQMNQLRRQNGMVPPNLQKTVLQNNTSGLYALSHYFSPRQVSDWGWTPY
mgnify:CR=1 FL=1|jgi:hypothetical protein